MKSSRGFAAFSLLLLLPVLAGLLVFTLRLTEKLNARDRARRICLLGGLALQRMITPLIWRPDIFSEEGARHAAALLVRIRDSDPGAELLHPPAAGNSPRIFTGAGAVPAEAVIYRLSDARLCGAYAERKDRTWTYRIIYHISGRTVAAKY